MRLAVFTRHAHSTLNLANRVNGDPGVAVPLTEDGREQARRLGGQLAALEIGLCVHTRFGRTLETAACMLEGRDVPRVCEPLLDDIDVGELEGSSIADYRTWKAAHTRADAFPGGESLDAAARRYVRGFRRILERPEQTILVVCHEIPIRYALNAAAGSGELDGPEHAIPNATPYLFDADALERAAQQIERLTG